jgi:hypothetical protein
MLELLSESFTGETACLGGHQVLPSQRLVFFWVRDQRHFAIAALAQKRLVVEDDAARVPMGA